MKTTHKYTKRAKGFTLVEILIVVCVLGLLAAFTVPKFRNVFGTTTDTQLKHNVSVVNGQLETFTSMEGQFGATPSVGSTTTDGVLPDSGVVSDIITALQSGVYIRGQLLQLPPGLTITGASWDAANKRLTIP